MLRSNDSLRLGLPAEDMAEENELA
eukprot:COSAG06_NODE_66189_length_255_cov_0.621795_1_plen_24_part_10